MWNPVKQPYRTTLLKMIGHGYNNHLTISNTFTTLEEAIGAAEAKFGVGIVRATVDKAINPADWLKTGKWQQIGERKRNSKFIYTA